MKVRLLTKQLELVHESEIPPFQGEQPAVIIWGTRIFKWHSRTFNGESPTLHYAECFYYALPEA